MADDYEAERPEEDQEGGPVKTFLEHLEDLRWVLIKSLVALSVAMLLCLIGGNYVSEIIKRPLRHARISYPGTNQVVTFFFGTNRLGVFGSPRNSRNLSTWGPTAFSPSKSSPRSSARINFSPGTSTPIPKPPNPPSAP